MPPKKPTKKDKPLTEELVGKFPPIQINFKITDIENFDSSHYSEYNIDFSHKEFPLLIVEEEQNEVLPTDGTGDFIIPPKEPESEPEKHIISNLYTEYFFFFDRNTITDINKLCDCPLFVGLYGLEDLPIENPADDIPVQEQQLPNKNDKKKGKRTSEITTLPIQKNRILLAYHFIDMLHWIRRKPVNITENIFLYLDPIDPVIPTPLINLHIESKKRLILPEFEFPNLCLITLESIFNLNKSIKEEDTISNSVPVPKSNKPIKGKEEPVKPPIIQPETEPPQLPQQPVHVAENIIVEFSLIKTDENGEEIIEPFCTFSNGHYSFLKQEDAQYRKWDSLPKLSGFGGLTSKKAKNSLRNQIFQEDEYLNLSKYDQNSELYLFNSMHRYLMPTNVCKNLECLINEEPNQIKIEVKYDDVEDVQLTGYADLAPLLYPDVTTGRFLVILENKSKSSAVPVPAAKPPDKKSKNDRKSKLSVDNNIVPEKSIEKSIFLIFELRFHTPISVISKIGIDPETFRMSEPAKTEHFKPTITEIARNTLINFENEVLTIVKQLPNYLTGQIINDEIICKDNSCKECLLAMQSNLVDNISKLISCIYNVQYPTKTNAEFRNLMTIVYNELTVKIEKIINDYYLGIDNSARVIDDPKIKNLKIFSNWESQEVIEFIGQSWISKRPDAILSGEDLLDVIMTHLHYYNFDDVQKRLDELLERNHTDYYGLLIKLYMIYINSDMEDFLPEILKVMQIYPYNAKLWSILYAIYDNVNYRPGAKYCKMKLTVLKRHKPYFWDRVFILFTQPKNLSEWKPLCDCVYILLKIGLFKFAALIYEKCKEQFAPLEGLRFNFLCKYFLRDYEGLRKEIESTPETPDNKFLMKLYWGHYYFQTGNKKLAKINYELFFHTEHKKMYLYDHLAFLRCGFMEIDEKNYENAETYFVVCVRETHSMIAWYGLGICLFRSNKFLKARQCFSKVTQYKWVKLPETWLYLAMISVQLQDFDLAKKFLELAEMSADTTVHGLNADLWNETITLFKANGINVKQTSL